MAATVTSNLTLLNAFDATTGWLPGTGIANETDDMIQGVACNAYDVDVATQPFSFVLPSGSSGDWSNRYIWIWIMVLTAPYLDVQSNGGIRIRAYCSAAGGISAGYADWYVGGSDTYSGGWRCFTASTAYTTDATASWDVTRVTRIGLVIKALQKSKLTTNVYWDYLRYGSGITITGGTAGDPGTFANILAGDQSLDIGAIRREGGTYFIQGSYTFGDTGASNSYFYDKSQTLIWEGIRTGNSFHQFNIVGGSGTNSFQLGDISGSGTSAIGSKGIYINTASHLWTFTAAETDIDTFKLGANLFINASNIYLGTTSSKLGGASSTIEIVDNTFSTPTLVTRNLETSASTLNQLRNKITFATDTGSSMNLYDIYSTYASQWQIIGNSTDNGPGFKATSSGTQSISIYNHNFNSMDKPYITLEANETWNSINPSWTITNQTELNFQGANTDRSVDEKFTVATTVQDALGNKISAAKVKIVENDSGSGSPALPNQASSDGDGLTSFDVLTRHIVGAAASALAITVHSGFSLKVYKFGKLPFAGSQTISAAVSASVTLLPDTFQAPGAVEATARSLGDTAGVTVTEQTNSTSIIKWTGGSGTLSVGNIIIGATSTADGVLKQIIEGDATAGTGILDTRDTNAFTTGGETLNKSGGGWTATFTASSETRYHWLCDAKNLTLQELYDYFNSKLVEDPIDTADNWDDVVIHGRSEYGCPIQGSGSKFITVRNATLSQGWAIYNIAGGLVSLNYFTADNDTHFTPAVTISVTLTNVVVDSRCLVYETTNPSNIILSALASSSTVGPFSYTGGTINVTIRVRKSSAAPKYLPYESFGTITSVDFTHAVNQIADSIAS